MSARAFKIRRVATPTAADRRAARKYGPSVRAIARQYRNPYTGKPLSGAALLLKLASGESGFQDNRTSTAGAKGRTQFMPGSRDAVLQKYGVDPWGSVDEAYHGAALHLRGLVNGTKGLEGYNPGSSSYPDYILQQKVGKTGGQGAGGGGGAVPGLSGTPGTVGAQNVAMGSTGALEAILALSQPKAAPSGSVPQAPAFSAAPTLPTGYQGVQSAGPKEAAGPDITSIIDALKTQGGDVQLAPGMPGTAGTPGLGAVTGGTGSTAGGGRVVVDPSADRAGAHTHKAVVDFARQVSAVAGSPIRIGTGTRHSRLTVNGNVSDHWSGNAADIPASGKRLIRLGQSALIAAGMPERKARQQTGGLFNVGGHQIIFNTQDGGDHTDHLHVSARRR